MPLLLLWFCILIFVTSKGFKPADTTAHTPPDIIDFEKIDDDNDDDDDDDANDDDDGDDDDDNDDDDDDDVIL